MTIPHPPAVSDLNEFPAYVLRPKVPLARVHPATYEPRWFGSSGGSRFDPPTGIATFGTCYLATSPYGAFVEVFGRSAVIRREDLDARCLSQLGVTRDSRLADFTDPACSDDTD